VKKCVDARRAANRSHAIANSDEPRHEHPKRGKFYGNVQETGSTNTAIIRLEPNLRITPPMQAEIIRLYMQGCTLCEISRRTGRARQTVTKVVRTPDTQDKILEMRQALLVESHDWVELLNRAVRHETDSKLAFKLARAFGAIPAIPSRKQNAPGPKPDNLEHIDPELGAKARTLEQIALERGPSLPPEAKELEKLAHGEPVHSKPKLRLCDDPD